MATTRSSMPLLHTSDAMTQRGTDGDHIVQEEGLLSGTQAIGRFIVDKCDESIAFITVLCLLEEREND